jgi:hypothetical protein
MNQNRIDFTDLLLETEKIADSKFNVDGFGKPYLKQIPWYVFSQCVENSTLEKIILINNEKDSLNIKNYNKRLIRIKETNRLKLINEYNKIFKAENNFYLVRLITPVYNVSKNYYASIIWIKNRSWTSGFHIYITFKIDNSIAKLISMQHFALTDVTEE